MPKRYTEAAGSSRLGQKSRAAPELLVLLDLGPGQVGLLLRDFASVGCGVQGLSGFATQDF